MIKAVRGAIVIEADTPEAMGRGITDLVMKMTGENKIREKDIVSILFTQTPDLHSANPASELRKSGFTEVPLFCCSEPAVEGMMARVVRVLITAHVPRRRNLMPVYTGGAELLRPDLTHES